MNRTGSGSKIQVSTAPTEEDFQNILDNLHDENSPWQHLPGRTLTHCIVVVTVVEKSGNVHIAL